MRLTIERTVSNRFVATSPDDIGIHVVANTRDEVIQAAKVMKRDLDEARAEPS